MLLRLDRNRMPGLPRLQVRIDNSTLPTEPWKFGKDYWSSFELYPEWTGNTYYGFRGVAFHRRDYWSETAVVVKTFRHHDGRAADWAPYKRRCDVARNLALKFNRHLQALHSQTRVEVVKPIDAVMDSRSDIMVITRLIMRFDKKFSENEAVLFEDLLEGDFKTFVTSKGEATCDESQVLDAFAHFTYQATDGNMVACDLRGVENDGKFRLTSPVIHSVDGSFGDSDKSTVGIRDFFQNHMCTALCHDFPKPDELFPRTPSAPVYLSCSTTSKEIDADDKTPMLSDDDDFQPPEYVLHDGSSPPPYTQ
ncbi:VWKA-like protein [Mya arenaria]|uniref:VWKA-like protein n=1 Tax=Mya arenaria TaxID=6604 RepID=A0ABY7ERY2_MYAAR|nr:VWKA-like protein [Mya arenaria]